MIAVAQIFENEKKKLNRIVSIHEGLSCSLQVLAQTLVRILEDKKHEDEPKHVEIKQNPKVAICLQER